MLLSPGVTSAHPVPLPAPAADELLLVRSGASERVVSGSAAPKPPSVWARYGMYLLDLPGAVSVSSRTSEPNKIRVEFENLELAALARNAVVDAVEGTTIVMQSKNERPLPTPGGPYPWNWWDNASNIFRAIAGVRGVVSVDRSTMGGTAYAESKAYADVLRPLFRSRLATGEYLGWQTWPHPPGGSRPPFPPS